MFKILLYILLPNAVMLIGLAMFASLPTAMIFISLLVLAAYLAVRFNDKHTHLEYDDRLSSEKSERALERYLKEVKG